MISYLRKKFSKNEEPQNVELHNSICPVCSMEGKQEPLTVMDKALGTLAWICPNNHCWNTYPDGRPY